MESGKTDGGNIAIVERIMSSPYFGGIKEDGVCFLKKYVCVCFVNSKTHITSCGGCFFLNRS